MLQKQKDSFDLMRPKESPKKLKKWLNSLAIILLFLALFFWFKGSFWRINRIECNLDGINCSAELWAELMSRSIGKNYLFLSLAKYSQEIANSHREFSSVEVKKKLPANLSFVIKRRKTSVILKSGDRYFFVDDNGFLLENGIEKSLLPTIFLKELEELKPGEKIQDQTILLTIKILSLSQLRLLEPKSAQIIAPDSIEIILKDDLLVLFSAQKDINVQLDSLQFILAQTKMKGEQVKKIDLQFEKPIIIE